MKKSSQKQKKSSRFELYSNTWRPTPLTKKNWATLVRLLNRALIFGMEPNRLCAMDSDRERFSAAMFRAIEHYERMER